MPRRFISALIVVAMIVLLAYAILLNAPASASPQELKVISETRGHEVVTAEVIDNQVRLRLKNNHKETITAFAIRFSGTTIKEDFAYSEVHFGIEPGETFEVRYPFSRSPIGSEVPTLYLLTVLLKNGSNDGNSKVAQEIKDERLGEKIQILRTLRILEDGQSRKDLRITKDDIVVALESGEFETLITLNELEPTSRINNKLSNHLRNGLQVGREKMLQRFEVVIQQPVEYREQTLKEFKDRANNLFAKL